MARCTPFHKSAPQYQRHTEALSNEGAMARSMLAVRLGLTASNVQEATLSRRENDVGLASGAIATLPKPLSSRSMGILNGACFLICVEMLLRSTKTKVDAWAPSSAGETWVTPAVSFPRSRHRADTDTDSTHPHPHDSASRPTAQTAFEDETALTHLSSFAVASSCAEGVVT